MKRPSRWLTLLPVVILACTPKAEPPPINSSTGGINTEACRDANLSIQKLDAVQIRSLVTCLNGSNDSVKPYKVFIDNMNTDDLNKLLEVYNRHVYSAQDRRLDKILDLVKKMRDQGLLSKIFDDLVVLHESHFIEKFLPVAKRFLENISKPGQPDTNIYGLNKFLTESINQNLISPGLIAAANAANGMSARVLSILISAFNANSVIDSDHVTDLMANAVLGTYGDNTHHAFLTSLSDPQIPRSFQVATDKQVEELADLFYLMPQGSAVGSNRMNRLRLAITGVDRPLNCFKNGNQSRHTDNLFWYIASESAKRSEGPEHDKLFLQVIPLMLATTYDSCDYSPDLIQNIEVLTEAVRLGYGDGLHGMNSLLINSGRFSEISQALKSEYIVQLAPVMEELALRGGNPFTLKIITKDLTPADLITISKVLTKLVSEDITGDELVQWITKNIQEPSRSILIKDLNLLPADKRNLSSLSNLLLGSENQDQALRDLKWAVGHTTFPNSYEQNLVAMAKKIFANEKAARQEIKDLARAMVSTFADTRGGLGDIVGILAQTSGLSIENPIQNLIHSLLSDQALLADILPIFIMQLQNPEFRDALEFTGKLVANGNLDRLIVFLVDLFRSAQSPALNPNQPGSQFHPPTGDPLKIIRNAKPFVPHSPDGQYLVCNDIKGSLFDYHGINLYKALKCIDADGSLPEISLVADHLQKNGALEELSSLLKTITNTSPFLNGTFNELEALLRNGSLRKVLKLFAMTAEEPYGLPFRFDPLVADLMTDPGVDSGLQLLGNIFQLPSLASAGQSLINLLSNDPEKTFFSDNNYRLTIHDPAKLRFQMMDLRPDLNPNQILEIYNRAAENFVAHNDEWLYEEGPFFRLSDKEWKAQIVGFFRAMLRSTDLKANVHALQDIARDTKQSFTKFLSDSIDDQRVVLHYGRNGQLALHIVTQLDELELLVVNSEFDVLQIPSVSMDFKQGVADSEDLMGMLKTKNTLLSIVQHVPFIGDERLRRIKNMLYSYDALYESAANGNLKIFQRIYRALKASTPAKYRDSKNPVLNHMGILDNLNNVQIFSGMVMGLSNAKRQGKLEQIVDGFMGCLLLLEDKDIDVLRDVMLYITAQSEAGDDSPLDQLLDKLLTLIQNPQGYQEFKDSLAYLAPGLMRLGVEPTGLLKSVPAFIKQPVTWNRILDKVISEAQNPKGMVSTLANNLVAVDDKSLESLREVMAVMFLDDPKTGANHFPDLVSGFSNGYAKRPDEYDQIITAFRLFNNDPRVVAMEPAKLFNGIFGQFAGQSGIGDGLGYIFLDPVLRKDIIHINYVMARQNDIASLARVLVAQINSGNFESALHFIFDNLVSTGSH